MALFRRARASSQPATEAGAIPIASGDAVLGTTADGEPITVPFFTERGVRAAALGDARLPKLLALRALRAGARVQVVTARPTAWLTLRDEARMPAERMAVVYPRTPPPTDSTRIAPWMVIDDTGTPATAAVARPWQAFVAAPSSDGVTIAGLRGLDAIILHRSTPACRAAVIVAMELPVPVVRSLHGIPGDVIVIARPGTVELVPLTLDAAEEALMAKSWPTNDAPSGPTWPDSPFRTEPRPPIWRSNDCLLAPELTGTVSVGAYNSWPGRDDA
jgi:hypothetical protein